VRGREAVHPKLALVPLRDSLSPMTFAYPPAPEAADALLQTPGWQSLRRLVADFRDLARELGAEPWLVFIPTKRAVYGDLVSDQSGARVLDDLRAEATVRHDSQRAFARLAREEDLPLVDLAAPFRERARAGELLYYPFDSHWNGPGRELAAQRVAEALDAAAR
jgi:hypothetical protein